MHTLTLVIDRRLVIVGLLLTDVQTNSPDCTRTILPVIICLHLGSPGIDGLPVVLPPDTLAPVIHLVGRKSQIYEAVIVHTNLNVFGA